MSKTAFIYRITNNKTDHCFIWYGKKKDLKSSLKNHKRTGKKYESHLLYKYVKIPVKWDIEMLEEIKYNNFQDVKDCIEKHRQNFRLTEVSKIWDDHNLSVMTAYNYVKITEKKVRCANCDIMVMNKDWTRHIKEWSHIDNYKENQRMIFDNYHQLPKVEKPTIQNSFKFF